MRERVSASAKEAIDADQLSSTKKIKTKNDKGISYGHLHYVSSCRIDGLRCMIDCVWAVNYSVPIEFNDKQIRSINRILYAESIKAMIFVDATYEFTR